MSLQKSDSNFLDPTNPDPQPRYILSRQHPGERGESNHHAALQADAHCCPGGLPVQVRAAGSRLSGKTSWAYCITNRVSSRIDLSDDAKFDYYHKTLYLL